MYITKNEIIGHLTIIHKSIKDIYRITRVLSVKSKTSRYFQKIQNSENKQNFRKIRKREDYLCGLKSPLSIGTANLYFYALQINANIYVSLLKETDETTFYVINLISTT